MTDQLASPGGQVTDGVVIRPTGPDDLIPQERFARFGERHPEAFRPMLDGLVEVVPETKEAPFRWELIEASAHQSHEGETILTGLYGLRPDDRPGSWADQWFTVLVMPQGASVTIHPDEASARSEHQANVRVVTEADLARKWPEEPC